MYSEIGISFCTHPLEQSATCWFDAVTTGQGGINALAGLKVGVGCEGFIARIPGFLSIKCFNKTVLSIKIACTIAHQVFDASLSKYVAMDGVVCAVVYCSTP